MRSKTSSFSSTSSSSPSSIVFASSNQNKFREVESILSSKGIQVEFAKLDLLEIQSDSLLEIACEKAKSAYSKVHRPVIVEDDGLFIKSLGGFPGPYSSYVFKTLGNSGILKLVADSQDRTASFRSVVAYFDGGIGNSKDSCDSANDGSHHSNIIRSNSNSSCNHDPIVQTFEGLIEGCISEKIASGGWGYDPIFVPNGVNLSFAELEDDKNSYSHRTRALDKFAEWFSSYSHSRYTSP